MSLAICKNIFKMKIKKAYWKYKKEKFLLRDEKQPEIQSYPTTIQFPITFKCNFDCKMCGMRKLISKTDITATDIHNIISDKLFERVENVGINGGEPFLKNDLVDCVKTMCEDLPRLKQFFIISNGYFSKEIIEKLKQIRDVCDKHSVRISLSLSIDGYKDMQDFMRGKEGAWNHVIDTINRIKEADNKLVDELYIVCTITKYNVYNLPEMQEWSKVNGITVLYNIATINKRIANEDKFEDFTILNDKIARMYAREFFYKLALDYRSEKYFALYLYLKDGKRYAPCPCQYNDWVTITPDGGIGYCATHSDIIGNALHESAYSLFNGNVDYLKEIVRNNCDGCSHYIYGLNKEGKIKFYNEMIQLFDY